MFRQTEKILKKVNEFIQAHQGEFNSEEEMNEMLQRFMEEENAKISSGKADPGPETADDYLELAGRAPSRKKQLEYVNKALELEPDNLDAGRMKAELTSKTPWEFIEELSQLLEMGNRQMKEEGFFARNCKGHFWGILETRPYMRVRHAYMRALITCGMLRRAAKECEEMLALCEGDNLGVRYDAMHLYAMLEEEKPAKALMKKYSGDDETQMLLPFSILHFKLGQMDESLAELKRLIQINKDTKKFLRIMTSGSAKDDLPEIGPYGYSPDCIEELVMEASSYSFLFQNSISYFIWADQASRKRAAKK